MAKQQVGHKVNYASVIGTNVKVIGHLEFTGGLYIDGSVQGDITAERGGKALLALDENSKIEGDVRAPEILLNGQVIGNVYASGHAELLPQARISGNLYYRSMQLALGAEVNGQLVHQEQAETLEQAPPE